MNVATIPQVVVAFAHIHVGFEVMLYILKGRVRHEFGAGLARVIDNEAGDVIFIEPGVPHEVRNLSETEPVVAVGCALRRLGVGEHHPLRSTRRSSEGADR